MVGIPIRFHFFKVVQGPITERQANTETPEGLFLRENKRRILYRFTYIIIEYIDRHFFFDILV